MDRSGTPGQIPAVSGSCFYLEKRETPAILMRAKIYNGKGGSSHGDGSRNDGEAALGRDGFQCRREARLGREPGDRTGVAGEGALRPRRRPVRKQARGFRVPGKRKRKILTMAGEVTIERRQCADPGGKTRFSLDELSPLIQKTALVPGSPRPRRGSVPA